MATEKLHFRVGLAGTYWSRRPRYSVAVNNTVVVSDAEITGASAEIQPDGRIQAPDVEYVEFTHEVEEGPVELQIRLLDKLDTDVVENANKTGILKDLLLNIRSVEIDEIDLGNLMYSQSQFVGDESHRPVLDACVDLGWRGTWTLRFESPFYIWLLENI